MALELAAGLLKKIHTVMPQSFRVDGAEMFYAYLKSIIYLEEQGRWTDTTGASWRPPGGTITSRCSSSGASRSTGTPTLELQDRRGDHLCVRRGAQPPPAKPRARPGTMAAELTHQFCLYRNGAGARAVDRPFLQAYASTVTAVRQGDG